MNAAEWLTRGTIWAALLCYGLTVFCERSGSLPARRRGRLLWTAGCILFLAHVAAAFHFYHHWSHAAAVEDTRRQTVEQVGLNFGGGLYFNYLFALVWLGDCIAWWRRDDFHAQHRKWFATLHTFFLFMIFNATVVFGRGMAKMAGIALFVVLALALLAARKRIVD